MFDSRLLCFESAGVDIKELKSLDFMNGFSSDFLRNLAAMFQDLRVPVIAAVKGFAVRSGSVPLRFGHAGNAHNLSVRRSWGVALSWQCCATLYTPENVRLLDSQK